MSHRTNPYVGPRSFRAGERLYGRTVEAIDLRDTLIAQRIVLFYSPSGAGKTSLLEAVLREELERLDFAVLPTIRVGHEATPGHPTANRYQYSTMQSLDPSGHRFAGDSADGVKGLPELLDSFEPEPGRPLRDVDSVLFFDQFEEVFTLDPADYNAKAAFITDLGIALRDKRRWAVLSMREDFIAHLDPFAHLIPRRLGTRYRLDLLKPNAARDAIQRPARDQGVDFTTEAADRLIDDLRRVRVQRHGQRVELSGPYVEPVQLQVVCHQLWEAMQL